MIKKIRDLDINYNQYGSGENIVLLHGWGQNIEMMEPIGKSLSNNHQITIVDLPGFGSSSEPTTPYNIYDYGEVLNEFLISLDIKNPILIGHSFGGRIAICYASKYSVKKLVLFGTPFVKRINNSLKVKVLKNLKKIKMLDNLAEYMKDHMGSTDYKQAKGIMREILVNTVNEDLTECAKRIKCEVLIIHGLSDAAVSLDEAKQLDAIILNSALITLNGTHYAYLENLNQVINILNNFI